MGFLARIGNSFRKTGNFFRDSWLELRKVRWPSRKELVSYTLVVICTVSIIALFFAVIDFGLSELLSLLFGT